MYIIAKDGSGDFASFQEAIHFLKLKPAVSQLPWTIFVKNGLYEEKIEIENLNLHIIGESQSDTILRYNAGAYDLMPDGQKRQTFRTATCFVASDYFAAENLTIENNAGDGRQVGQAIALYLDCTYASLNNCQLLANQDTLFLGPLPPSERIPGSFIGPRQYAERKPTYSQFSHCFIKGDIDFIFGSGKADFVSCDIFSNNRNQPINGYIAAPSTPKGQEDGFQFINCHLIADPSIEPASVYLARPWRPFGRVLYYTCKMDNHIHPEGWDLWGNPDNAKTVHFMEVNTDTKENQERPPYIEHQSHPSLK